MKPFEWLYYEIRAKYRTLARMWAYARIGAGSYDFDSCYLIRLIIFKLQRMQQQFTHNSHCVHAEDSLKALALAIRLGTRLSEDTYSRGVDLHSKKWGELNMDFIPLDPDKNNGFKGSELKMWRSGTTPENKEQERIEFLAAVDADDDNRIRDARLFFNIIAKYYRDWWD